MNPTWLHVGLLYAAGVIGLRRFEPELRSRVALLFYVLVLAFFFRPMTGDWVNVPTDLIERVDPWTIESKHDGRIVANRFLEDVSLQMVPFAHEVREAWLSGRLPLWQDLTECGSPLLGNGQSAALSPLRLLMLPLSLGHAMTGEAALKVLLALTFTYPFCRRRKYSEGASIIAAISFGFSLFIVVWLHFAMGTVAAFLPAVFYSVELLRERRSRARFAFAAITWGVTLLGGHIETAAHIALIATLYVIWLAAFEMTDGRLAFLGSIAGAGAAAAVIASPLLISLAETIVRSRRYFWLHQKPYEAIPFSDYPSLFVCLQPRFLGATPRDYFGPAHPESVSGFAGVLGVAGLVAVLSLIPFGRRWRNAETFFALAWIASLGAIADVVWERKLLSAIIPFTAHARIRVILCWLTALLAAALVDLFRRRAAVLLGCATVAAVMAWTIYRIRMPDAELQRSAIVTSIPAFAVLLFACALVVPRWRRFAVPLLAAAALVEMWMPGYDWNPVRRSETLFPTTPMIRTLQRLDSARERIVGTGSQLFPNTNAIFGLPDIRHNDPLVKIAYVRALSLAAESRHDSYYATWTDTNTPFLDFLNVRWVVTSAGAPLADARRYRQVYAGADGLIYENNDVLPRFYAVRDLTVAGDAEAFEEAMKTTRDWRRTAVVRGVSAGPIVLRDLFASHEGETLPPVDQLSADPTRYRLRVTTPRNALVVSSIPFWPGWRASSAGRALQRVEVNGAFLGFVVPPGSSTIDVAYRPWPIYASLLTSAGTVLALLAAALMRRTTAVRRQP